MAKALKFLIGLIITLAVLIAALIIFIVIRGAVNEPSGNSVFVMEDTLMEYVNLPDKSVTGAEGMVVPVQKEIRMKQYSERLRSRTADEKGVL